MELNITIQESTLTRINRDPLIRKWWHAYWMKNNNRHLPEVLSEFDIKLRVHEQSQSAL